MDTETRAPGAAGREPFIGKMMEALGLPGGAQRVFGEPVERDGTTVIPVAWASWGVGGGEGPAGRPEKPARHAAVRAAEPVPSLGGEEPSARPFGETAGPPPGAAEQVMGSGGGGGAMIKPMGFIEIREGRARFHRIEGAPLRVVAIILAAAFAARVLMKEIRRMLA